MRGVDAGFNFLLAIFIAAAMAVAGCASKDDGKGKPLKHIRVHVESRHDIQERALVAEIGGPGALKFSVEKLPILNEVHVERAALVDQPEGFQMRLKFDSLGTRILESYSSAALGKHFAIMTEIDGETRWIAAPLVRGRLGDGVLTFTPLASREDMERLVAGLNAEVEKRRSRWLQ